MNDGTATGYYLKTNGVTPSLDETASEYYIKENVDGSITLIAVDEDNTFYNDNQGHIQVASGVMKEIYAVEMVENDDDAINYVAAGDYVYGYKVEDHDLNVYLDDNIPTFSWENEGYVTLQNGTLGINGDYISMNEKSEGILVDNEDVVLTLNKTADEGEVIPQFFISKWIGDGAERAYMFNPIDSVNYQVNIKYDPQYQLGQNMTKAMFKTGVLAEDHSQMTISVKGETRVIENAANADGDVWAGLNRFKFQIVKTADDDTYYIRQIPEKVATIIENEGEENEEVVLDDENTFYLSSVNDYLYLTPDKTHAMEVVITETDMPTANESIADEAEAGVQVIAGNGQVEIQGAAGKNVVIANILGKVVANTVLTSDNATITVPAGIVVVTVEGETAVKAVVK